MKRFEYMSDYTIREQCQKEGYGNKLYTYFNVLGQQGWEIEPFTDFGPGTGARVLYHAKREIIDEPSPQRTVRREMEYSRA